MATLEDFKQFADHMSEEYNNDPDCTYEFSTSGTDLAEKIKYVHAISLINAYWTYYWCSTCCEFHGKLGEFHFEIVKSD